MATGGRPRPHANGSVSRCPRDARLRRQSGQNSIEYVGFVVLVAAVVLAIASTGVAGAAVDGFQRAIGCVLAGQQSAACRPQAQGRNLTPLKRATRGDYIALGDSYSSGEGSTEFEPGTDQDVSKWESFQEAAARIIPFWENDMPEGRNMCHRSTTAYSQRIYEKLDFDGDLGFHACSGAEIKDLLPGDQLPDANNVGTPDEGALNVPDHTNVGEAPQLDHLDEDTSLVTVSIGGNDVGFAEVVKKCVLNGITEWTGGCRQPMDQSTREKIINLEDELVGLYNKIQQQAPNARVVVVGYPRMFPDRTYPPLEVGPSLEWGDIDEPIEPADQQWMNDMARLLNRTTENAARTAEVEYVDVYDALDGHEIGTQYSWINDTDFELENGKAFDMGSFHPNDRGQAAIAQLVEQHVREGS